MAGQPGSRINRWPASGRNSGQVPCQAAQRQTASGGISRSAAPASTSAGQPTAHPGGTGCGACASISAARLSPPSRAKMRRAAAGGMRGPNSPPIRSSGADPGAASIRATSAHSRGSAAHSRSCAGSSPSGGTGASRTCAAACGRSASRWARSAPRSAPPAPPARRGRPSPPAPRPADQPAWPPGHSANRVQPPATRPPLGRRRSPRPTPRRRRPPRATAAPPAFPCRPRRSTRARGRSGWTAVRWNSRGEGRWRRGSCAGGGGRVRRCRAGRRPGGTAWKR